MKYLKKYESTRPNFITINRIEEIESYLQWLIDDLIIEVSEINYISGASGFRIIISNGKDNFILGEIEDKLYQAFDHIQKKYYISELSINVVYRGIILFNYRDELVQKSIENIFQDSLKNWEKLKPSDTNTGKNLFNRELQRISIAITRL
jgi:hypothetical protein